MDFESHVIGWQRSIANREGVIYYYGTLPNIVQRSRWTKIFDHYTGI
jgi:hypothetical protein